MTNKIPTKDVVYSMTTILVPWMGNQISWQEVEYYQFWFNCWRAHLFPEDSSMAPYEVTWGVDDVKSEYEYPLIPISTLPPKAQHRFKRFQEMILEAESRGDVSWRCCRERTCECKEPTPLKQALSECAALGQRSEEWWGGLDDSE